MRKLIKNPAELTLSPTKVDTFYGCRRLFLYTYLMPFTPKENKYFLIGNIAHNVLENLHKQQMNDAKINWKSAMGQHFKNALTTYKAGEKIKQGVIVKDDLLSIRRMLKNYLKYLKRSDAPKVVQVEKLAKIKIDNIIVWLKADRIDDLGENTYKVIDYKSGSPATKKAELASVQIPSYGIWLRQTLADADYIKGEYFYLKYMDSKKGIHSYNITDEMMDKAREKYTEVDQALKNGCKFTQNFGYKYCRVCDFKRVCIKDKNDGIS
jgi:RecB family exonuclease